ncbi:RNAase G [Metamycoplasma hyosynoviae]|uniref:RNAase G n=1 Tax=Metamycoplasma hyosynoviae TaxID=29559 RepID=A0A4P1QGB9_9BACT|nr:RNAase G [Metamycoplasma hyosynoviae]
MGSITSIQAFKFDGTLYRQYEGAKIVANLNDFVVVLLMKTKVSEKDITWVVGKPILFFFAKNKFYNASITLNRSKNNYIYVNLASPFYIDNGVLKYIDFDIDIKSYADKEFNVIDWQDFKESIEKMNYPFELIHRLYDEIDFLYDQFKHKTGIFSKKLINNIQKMLIEEGDI